MIKSKNIQLTSYEELKQFIAMTMTTPNKKPAANTNDSISDFYTQK